MNTLAFPDLHTAGRELGRHLTQYAGCEGTVVLALVRAGFPVAVEVAEALGLPLDLLLLRRLLQDPKSELPLCVFNVAGTRVIDEALPPVPDTPHQPVEFHLADALAEFSQRERICRGVRPPLALAGKTVLLVDSGIATGGTYRAAIRGLRALGPAQVIAAVPVAAEQARGTVEAVADELICLRWLPAMQNVAMGYRQYRVPGIDQIGEGFSEQSGVMA